MRDLQLLMGTVVLGALLATGCTGGYDVASVRQTMTYSFIDSGAMAYTDAVAFAPLSDHPLRLLAFAVHPGGVALDYAINRPLYDLASLSPALFGYTGEDAMLRAAR